MAIFTLLTDFGLQDSYVAEMKAALLAIQPKATIVDITHGVPAFQIEAGAFQLLRAHQHFPRGTWHVAVVDPGVGSDRRPIYVQTKDHHFVGPDNGLLRWAVRACEKRDGRAAKVFEIPTPKDLRPTFHGRDLFAPFAARRSKGPVKGVKPLPDLLGRNFPQPQAHGVGWRGEIVAVDHYGNLVTSFPAQNDSVEATLEGKKERLLSVSHYAAIPEGRAALIRGSHGFWEIAAKNASAAQRLGLSPGANLTLFVSDRNEG